MSTFVTTAKVVGSLVVIVASVAAVIFVVSFVAVLVVAL
jgi:hypothetical protein